MRVQAVDTLTSDVLATTDVEGRLLLRTPDAILERIGVDADGRGEPGR